VAKKRSTGQAVTPVPRSRTAALTKPSSQKADKEVPSGKKKNEIKKENSYDASDSDSEHGSVDRLNTDGDFGYETGSLDDSDVSTGDLLSPSGKDEQKTILMPSKSTGYSYAEVEFTPLLVTDEGGIATRHPEADTELTVNGDHSSYTYAGDEFRPLIVAEDVGIAAPVEARKSSKEPKDANEHEKERSGSGGRPPPIAYEEVKVVDGGFDRSNIKVVPANQRNVESESDTMHSVVGPQNDLYAIVQKKPKDTDSKESDNIPALRQDGPVQRPFVELGDVVPAIPGARKDSSMYEAITGELQSMILACDDVELEEGSSRKNSTERKTSSVDGRLPPPKPKPYAGPGLNRPVEKEQPKEEEKEDNEKGLCDHCL